MTKAMIVAAAIAVLGVTSSAAALRPPYLTQAKPVYGDVTIARDPQGRVLTYRGDWVMAIFDYDTINGNPNVKRVPYTVCRIATGGRKCVRRVWSGKPDVWMIRVLDWVGNSRYFEFTWTSGGKRRGTARVWIYE